ncbi:nucleoside 2-deoxyribosyltransferase [Ancylobacter sp. WKF20]|uniref:nucleoside 2-deoxyribosyltransferase n=1 Tax=Ancylobacter sp. WKF20 TaxID=3039801 RepID=UPI0024341299|nr:nucleoside 2-deoxyribosyltransferase [Ancylobacter sp. WKF20]WGD31129.1 nucleoside 2-deoxyribosyltransferase [Ancylobacter sp. WKF20]
MSLRLYLAGPDVFRPDAAERGAALKALCASLGVEGLYPLDGTTTDIRGRCIAMIHEADAIIADISPFRGVHMDPGTAFEIGYGEALGKPFFLWSQEGRTLTERVPADERGRDAQGHLVEDFGKPENLMIVPDGQRVWSSPAEAIAEAVEALSFTSKNRQLQRQTRAAVLVAIGVSLIVALSAGMVVDWLVGW